MFFLDMILSIQIFVFHPIMYNSNSLQLFNLITFKMHIGKKHDLLSKMCTTIRFPSPLHQTQQFLQLVSQSLIPLENIAI